ncbi:phage tail tape measure protein [Entomomonas asaccharolytica]|uniref:Phage-related protein n=1 Tax=Entomomonas asaccharolytica TaxID=2785331 RepID=A0A974RY52_9GAMM|nr:hypothetical protein [Entomomonas asaccharolytica]QQP86946.1 hypothetical protein JHT90_06790 [Entomomonas asaccharolytica]
MILDEFLIKLGAIADTKEVSEFSKGLQNVGKVATALVGTIGGLTAGITAFFGSALGGLDDLANLSADTNTSLSFIQKLGYAAQLSGSSVEEANASIKGLSQTIGEAANGLGRGAASFKALGLSAKNADGSIKSTEQVLGEVQAKLVGLSKQQQISLLQKLGISQSMVQLLSDTTGKMSALMAEAEALGIVTAEGADAAGEYNDAIDRLRLVTGALRTNIAVGLAPALTDMANRFKNWLVVNKDLIRDGLEKTVKFILAMFQAIVNFVTALYKVIDATIGWKAALVILMAILIKVKFAMIAAFAVNPITWIVLAIVGLIALIDDFITYLEGGESFFGDYWKPFADALASIKPILDKLKPIIDAVFSLMGKWVTFLGSLIISVFKRVATAIQVLVGIIASIADTFRTVADVASEVFQGIADFVGTVWEYISEAGKPVIDFFMNAVNSVFAAVDKVRGFFSKVIGGIKNGIKAVTGEVETTVNNNVSGAVDIAQNASAYANNSAQPSIPARYERTIQNNQDVKINISTSDPVVAGKTAASELTRQQRLSQRNNGGATAY